MSITSATYTVAMESALAAAARGWHVFPLAAKVPFAGSHGHLDATADPAAVRAAMNNRRASSFGIATGAGSGLVVIDVDGAAGRDSLAALAADLGPLPDTPTVVTASGGEHRYFAHPGGHVPSSAGKLAPGIDIRPDGAFAVGAGSVLPDGRAYQWECSSHPDDVPLAVLPARWLAAIRATPVRPTATTDDAEPIAEGGRDHGLTRIAGHLRRAGLSESAMRAALQETNAERCQPPLPDAAVARIAASVARYPAGQLPPMPTATAADPDPCADTRDALAATRAELATVTAERDRLRAERDATRQRAETAERRAGAAEAYARARQRLDAAGTLRGAEAPVAEAAARTLVAAMGHASPMPGGWFAATAVEVGAKAGVHARTAGVALANISSGGVIEYRALRMNNPDSGEVHRVGHLRPGPLFPADVAPGLAGIAGVLDAIAAHPIERTRRGAPVGDHGGIRVKSDRPLCPHCGGTEVACVDCGAILDATDVAAMLAADLRSGASPDAPPPTTPPTVQLVPSVDEGQEMALRPLSVQVVPSVATPPSEQLAPSAPAEPPWMAEAPAATDPDPDPWLPPSEQLAPSGPRPAARHSPRFGALPPAAHDRYTDSAGGRP